MPAPHAPRPRAVAAARPSLDGPLRLARAAMAAALVALALLAISPARAQERVVRIGFQKYGSLALLKGRGDVEPRLKALGYRVVWSEFPSGPPLMEAINAGAIDIGTAGETPPIFAQAAADAFLYVGHEPPSPGGEAILVRKDGPLRGVADLRGRKVALNKGSNVHYLLVRALAQAGLGLADITPVYLAPADGRAAFERGAVDVWVIWDPFLAAAEAAGGTRQLADGTGLVPNHQFYLAGRAFAEAHGPALDAVLGAIGEVGAWAKADPAAVARELAPAVGIPAPILATAIARQNFGVRPLDAAVVAQQQAIADTFHGLGLLPRPLDVAQAVRKPGS